MDSATLVLLQKAAQKRETLRAHTNAVRLVNGYGDELDGLVIEQHADHGVAQVFEERWLDEKETLVHFARSLGMRYFVLKDRSASVASTPDAIKSHVLSLIHI